MIRILFVIFAAVVSLAAPSRGFAQEAAYQFTPPPGWVKGSANGAVVFLPPQNLAGDVSIVLLPVQPLGANLEQQAQAVLTALETSMQLDDPRRIPVQRGKIGTAEHVITGGTFISKASHAPNYIVVFARGDKGAFGALVLIATSHPAYTRNSGLATAMFNTLRLTDQAAQLAAANAAGANAQGGTQAQPQGQGQPAQEQPQSPVTPVKPQTNGGTPPAEGAPVAHTSVGTEIVRNATLQDLTGIWVGDTAIRRESFSFGSYTDRFGTTYNTTTLHFQSPLGAGGQYLKVLPDGSYQFYHNFVLNFCGAVVNHRGSLSVANGQVTLHPVSGHEVKGPVGKASNCETVDRDIVPPMQTFNVELSAYSTVFGYPTYRLRLNGVGVATNTFHVIDRLEARPLPSSPPPMTRNFHPGNGHAASDLQGTWVAPEDTPANFSLDAADDGKYRAVLRLLAGGRYELTVRRPNVLYAPVCGKHVSLVEQGEALFAGQINPNDNRSENGAMVLKPAQSRLSVEVTNCGPDDSKAVYNLSVGPRYMRWNLNMQNPVTAAPLAGDKLNVVCPDVYEAANTAAWGFLSCPEKAGQLYSGYVRR